MIKQMSVCSKASIDCIWSCPNRASEHEARMACLGVCSTTADACRKQCSADYGACVEAGRVQPSAAPKEEPTGASPSPESTTTAEFKPYTGEKIPVFIHEWFQALATGMMAQEFVYGTGEIMDEAFFGQEEREIVQEEQERELRELDRELNSEALWQYGVDPKDLENREPQLTRDRAREILRHSQQADSPYRIETLQGDLMVKYPGENEWQTWHTLEEGDAIPPGTRIFTGMDSSAVLSVKDTGVIQLLPFTEIIVTEEGLKQAAQENKTSTKIELQTGEVELDIEGGLYEASLQVQTPNVVAGVRGTRFWVAYNKKQKLTTVGVYEGTVAVATADGQSVSVEPGDSVPGVLVISSKLSYPKLGLVLVIVMGVVVGLILVIRKKRLKKRGLIKKAGRKKTSR